MVSGFGLVVMRWALNVRYAFAQAHPYPPAVLLPAHFVVIAAITTIAAGLGSVAGAPAEHLTGTTRWLLCAGVAAFLLMISLLSRATRRWPVTVAALALPLVAGVLGPLLPAAVVGFVLLAACFGQGLNLRGAVTSGP